MVLVGKMLNETASLNEFNVVGNIEFMPEASLNLAIMLVNPEKNIRYVLPSTAIVTFTFPTVSGTDITKIGSFISAGDRSLIAAALTAAETLDMSGGNFTFVIDVLGDATSIIKGYVSQGLSRITAGEPCC